MTEETKAPAPPTPGDPSAATIRPNVHPQSGSRGLSFLREPVPTHLISPKAVGSREHMDRQATGSLWKLCDICHAVHHPSCNHLSYVGHGATTAIILEADINWTWEPLAYEPDGLPRFDKDGGLWIKLTIAAKTRLGYGNAKQNDRAEPGSRIKEVIGDAIRNAGQRFGIALELWSKADIHHVPGPDEDDPDAAEQKRLQEKAGQESQAQQQPATERAPKPAAKTTPAAAGTEKRSVQPYPEKDFDRNLPTWVDTLLAGTKTFTELVSMIQRRGALSDDQINRLRQKAGLNPENPAA